MIKLYLYSVHGLFHGLETFWTKNILFPSVRARRAEVFFGRNNFAVVAQDKILDIANYAKNTKKSFDEWGLSIFKQCR